MCCLQFVLRTLSGLLDETEGAPPSEIIIYQNGSQKDLENQVVLNPVNCNGPVAMEVCQVTTRRVLDCRARGDDRSS